MKNKPIIIYKKYTSFYLNKPNYTKAYDYKYSLYSKDDNAYHIFGIDMMIDDNFIPKLIEINFAPGFGHKKETKDATQSLLSNNIYGWINETVLKPLLEPLLKPLEAQAQEPDQNTIIYRLLDIRKHPTYIIPYNKLKKNTL